MHASVMNWLTTQAGLMAVDGVKVGDVLEVGSFNENGSARDIFEEISTSYIGIDQREGRDVDRVMSAADIIGTWSGRFDLVICAEMLEHDPTPWITFKGMAQALKPGGHLLATARGFDAYGGYPEHPCPKDYWRLSVDSMLVLIDWAGLRASEVIRDPEVPGVFGHAVKP